MGSLLKYKELDKKFTLKYAVDRVVAPVLLAISLPILLLGAFIIKLYGWFYKEEAGSVFYTETRISAGKKFKIIKFRTITNDKIEWIRALPEKRSITASSGITHAGRIILKWYMDELPQLFNIAKGDMSFVGPRPHILNHHNEDIKAGLTYRNVIKAGLLGIPQACKIRPEYAALLEDMARTHKPTIRVLNKLDALYPFRCMEKTPFEILLFDISVVVQGLIVVLRGIK